MNRSTSSSSCFLVWSSAFRWFLCPASRWCLKAELSAPALALAFLLGTGGIARAASISWTNVNGGNWSAPANWSPNQVPGPGDTAAILVPGTYTVALDASPTIAGLTLGGPNGQQTFLQNSQPLTVTGALTINSNAVFELTATVTCNTALNISGQLNWNAGTIHAAANVANGGTLSLLTGGDHELSGGTLSNSGTVRWIGGGRFWLEDGSTFTNQAAGLFDASADALLTTSGPGPNRFLNLGTFRKSAGAFSMSITSDFENRGQVQIQSGTLTLPNGFTSSGSFSVSDGARLSLSGGVLTLQPGNSFTGAGFYGVENGNVTIIGDITAANFQFASGAINSSNQITGTLHWISGKWFGNSTVAAGGTLVLETSSDHELSGNFTNAGTVQWSNGRFFLEDGTSFANQGLVDLACDFDLLPSGAGPNRFINTGTFRKSAAAFSSAIQVAFENHGQVQVQSGTLSFPNGFTSSGTFAVSANARVSLNGGLFTFQNGNGFSGDGFYGVENGLVTILGDLNAPNFQLSSGNLTGTNRITGTVHWLSGHLQGNCTVVAGGALTLETASDHEFIGNLSNSGTVSWKDGGRFYLENGSTFLNQANGLFDDKSDAQLLPSGAVPNQFINEGTFRKSAAAFSTSVNVDFQNRGQVQVQSGTLSFPNGFASSGGFVVSDGARLSLDGGTFNLQPGNTFSGAGFYGIANGSATIVGDIGAPGFQLTGGILNATNRITGTLRWSAGLLQGNFTVAAGGTLSIETSSDHSFNGSITNSGTVHWIDAGPLTLNGPFANQSGALFDAASDGQMRRGDQNPASQFVNDGTFRKSAAAFSTTVEVPLNNRGIIEVASGTLAFQDSYTLTGGTLLLNGASVSSQLLQLNGGVLSGTGTVLGTVNNNSGKVNPGNPNGALTINGDYSQGPNGELVIELAGLTTDSFDQLAVSGAAQLDGALTTTLIKNFSPPVNSTFDFLSARTLTGVFAKQNVPPQIDAQVTYTPTSASLKVVNVSTNVSKFPPVLAAIPNQTVNELSLLRLTATATDADVPANILTFRLDSAPPGAAIDPNSGVFTWTPNESQGPGVYPITVRVTDNGGLFDTKTFSVTVNEVNQPPVLTVIPPQIIGPGLTLKFTATATDPDLPAQKLTFSLGPGAPAGATINSASGEFTWNVPASQPAGIVTANVRVSDDFTPPLTAAQDVLIEVDRTGPRIVDMSPTGQVSRVVQEINLRFDSVINPASLDANDAVLTGPSGAIATTVQALGESVVRVSFDALAPGNYTLKFGPNVTNLAGNPMDQNGNGTNGEPTLDVFTGQLSVGFADLQVTAIKSPAQANIGQPIEIDWTLINKGNVAATPPWTDTLLLRQNAAEQLLANFVHDMPLATNQSLTYTQSVILPANLFGQWQVVVRTDTRNDVAEGANETNNETVATQTLNIVAPDLVVTSVSVPATAQFGQTIPVTWTVKNQGTGPASANWNDYIYLAPQANLASAANLLGTGPTEGTPALAAGASYTRTQNFALPLDSNLTPGQFFVIVNSNGGNTQPESAEDNNLASKAITLSRPPLPDLAVLEIRAPATAIPGQPVNLVWVLTNRGNLAASGTWSDTISLSNQPALATIAFTNTIPPGGSLTRTQSVTIPIGGPAGAVTFVVETDSNGEIPESNEDNNIAAATTATTVPATLTLAASLSEIPENAPNPTFPATVTRNGDLSLPLTVALTSSLSSQLSVPTNATIPAGQVTASFDVTVHDDGIVTAGPQLVTISATAPAFTTGTAQVSVLNTDLPHLTLKLAQDTTVEGTTIDATLQRDLAGPPITVQLASSDNLRVSVPATVGFAANQSSVVFTVRAVDDTLIESTHSYTITASADDFLGSSATLQVTDDDVPALTLQISPGSVSKGAGALAALGTITRDSVAPRDTIVALESDNENAARVPSTVTIPAGALSATFPIAAIDNTSVTGKRTVFIRAYPTESISGARLALGASAQLNILDDSGPTLRLTINRDLVAEGLNPAATGTVTRNSATNAPLVVTLASSATNDATVPPTVTIPAGQASATFSIASMNDNVTKGDKSVTITADATGFTGGSATLIVTDRALPDLHVASVTIPDAGATDSSFEVTYRIENNGSVATSGGFTQRVFLSNDPAIGDDTLLSQNDFTSALPAGGHFDQTLSLRLPQKAGDYWVVVVTDVNNSVAEVLENNNAAISSHPIHVQPAYSATVQTDLQVAPAGTPVPLRGTATSAGNGQSVAFVPVNIHLQVRDVVRVISAITDANGKFAATFQPLPGEAGQYQVGATHPGVDASPVQDTFTLLGLRATPQDNPLRVIEGATLTSSIKLENLSDLPLTNLTATVVQAPANLQVALSLQDTTLPGSGQVSLNLTARATDTSIAQSGILIRISNPDGVTNDVSLPVTIAALRPQLTADPVSLLAGMKRGVQSSVQFQVTNTGGAPSGDLKVLPPVLPWLTVSSGGQISSLPPGASAPVTITLTPPVDLPLGDFQGTIAISGAAANLTVPFTFRSLSDALGDLKISAVDEYTYYAQGSPPVTNATVTLTDELSGDVIASGLTDAKGELLLHNLKEAYYRIEAKADGHASFKATSLVAAGKTNEVLAFLNRETVKYIWTVVPTEIEDRTKIVIETVFETVVPFPVVTVEPMVIDLDDIQGDQAQIDLKITNHGLVAAIDTHLQFQEHPNFSVTPLVSDIGVLAAKSSITVPLAIKRLRAGTQAVLARNSARVTALSAGGGCDIAGGTFYSAICGPVKRDYSVPLILRNASHGCGGGSTGVGGGGFGELFGGGGGTGFEGGGGSGRGTYVAPVFVNSPAPCNLCPLQRLQAGAECGLKFVLNDGTKCIKDLGSCFTGKPDETKTQYKCLKSIYSCAKAIGVKVAGAGVVGTFKFFECAYAMATACDAAKTADPGGELFAASSHGLPRQASIASPELVPLVTQLDRLQKLIDLFTLVWGDTVWFEDESGEGLNWLGAFVDSLDEAGPDGAKISSTERAALLARTLPDRITAEIANRLIDRWNRTFDYWNAGILNLGDVPLGQSADFVPMDQLAAKLSGANDAITASESEGFQSVSEGVESARQDLIRFYTSQGYSLPASSSPAPAPQLRRARQSASGGDCATVRLRIEQQAVITRDAFNASLEIANSTGDPLADVSVDLEVRAPSGEVTTGLFAIRPPTLTGLNAVDGSGVVQPNSTGKASWIIIPTADAAPTGPTVMLVSGTLIYSQNGVRVTVPLAPASITVLPNASLKVKYFHQRDVFADDPFTEEIEPSIPFSLGVLIQNNGHGAARHVRLTSAQPKIVDNQKGLLIDFEIIATEIGGQSLSPSLTADFGDIAPGQVAEGRWLLRSSLQGLFVDYKASFENLDGLGDKRLSLIDSVEIHELNHVVRADRTFEDGKLDFLVNDVPDLQHLPDTLYLSDGTVQPVSLSTTATVDSAPSAANLQVKLSAAMPQGWTYLQIPDPADGKLTLAKVLRSDGSEVTMDYNVWTTDRTFVGNGKRPVRENIFHLLDFNSDGAYTLFYTVPPAADLTPPVSKVEVLPANSFARIPVRWSGTDSGAGIDTYDIFVSIDGGPFNLWLRKTTLTGALYDGTQNSRYAFYSVATDKAGNVEAPHSTPDAQTLVALVNTAPTIQLPATVSINEGETLTATAQATDADVPANVLTFSLDPGAPAGVQIDPSTGVLTWPTGESTGPSTNKITVRVTDNGVPSLSAAGTITVVVNEVNQPPQIDPIDIKTISEGVKLTFIVTATDPDLPANILSFKLGPGAPDGVALTSAGVFSWTPNSLQGPSTNIIPIIVTDNGAPPLSSTSTVTVVVRDALGDFIFGIGSTNVLSHQSGVVPIDLSSGIDLTGVNFVVGIPTILQNVALRPVSPQISVASLHATSSNEYNIELSAAAGNVLQGNQTVAQLTFDVNDSGDSVLIPLTVSQVVGNRTSGAPLTKPTIRDGRVIIVGKQPFLEATRPGASNTLVLYGRVGASYSIESTAALKDSGAWTLFKRVPQTAPFQVIGDLPAANPALFFRAFEFNAQPALLSVARGEDGNVSILLYGEPGKQYQIEALSDFATAADSIQHESIALTNSFQFIETSGPTSRQRFYRVRKP